MGSGASSDPWMSRMYPDELVENDRIPGWWRFSKIFGIFNPIFLGKFMIQFDESAYFSNGFGEKPPTKIGCT